MASGEELYQQGLLFAQGGDFEQALHSLLLAYQKETKAEYSAAIGNVHCLLGDEESALHYLKQACESDPSSAWHRSDLAGVLYSMGRHSDAIHFYQEAIEGDPLNPEHFFRLACCHFYRPQPNLRGASLAARQAVALYPTEAKYQKLLGLSAFRQHDFGEAVEAFALAARLGPDQDIFYNLSCAHFAAGDFLAAAEAAHAGLDLDEEQWHPKLTRLWALALFRAQNWEQAALALEQASQLHPEDVELFSALAEVLLRQEDFQAAARTLQKATMVKPESSQLHYSLGTAWLKAAAPERAVASLSKALALDPSGHQAWNNLALALWLGGQAQPAEQAIQRALELQPENPLYLATLQQIRGD